VLATGLMLAVTGQILDERMHASVGTSNPMTHPESAVRTRLAAAGSSTTLVQFTETGLRSGSTWWVDLGRTNSTGFGSEIAFFEPAGTYSYHVGSVGYTVTPGSGTITTSGVFYNVTVTFHILWAGPYTVTFREAGLPNGSNWSLAFNGTTIQSNGSRLVFDGMNPGTYRFSVPPVGTYSRAPMGGIVTVGVVNVTVWISFYLPPPGPAYLGPIPLTWGWEFAVFALALWIGWVGYRIIANFADYRSDLETDLGLKRRRVLNYAKLAVHGVVTVFWVIGFFVVFLSSALFTFGPAIYGLTLLLLLLFSIARSDGAFAPGLGGSYWDRTPAEPQPCWRCGWLAPADSHTCPSCGASIE